MDKKLVLFDIDGTLIYHVGSGTRYRGRMVAALEVTWNVPTDKIDLAGLDGWPDRGTAWEVVKNHGVTRAQFAEKFPQFVQNMQMFMDERAREGKVFEAVADAKQLVHLLKNRPNTYLGLLTGNVQSIAWWKLIHTGLKDLFQFGLFGDEAEDRITLAGMIFAKAKTYFGLNFEKDEIVIIGDTIYDIRCGKSIGAETIAVMTGFHKDKEALISELPDYLVESLMDPAILNYFQLPTG